MSIHVAILKSECIDLILQGRKTIESRLTINEVTPFREITSGEWVFLKHSGGPFAAIARAGRVDTFEGLTPTDVNTLRRRYESKVLGGDDYWKKKAGSRYATMVELCEVSPLNIGPVYPKSAYKAWHVLPDDRSPIMEATLTTGAIRNRYVTLPTASEGLRQSKFTLLMPDDEPVETDIVKGNMIRWRGWGDYYTEHGMRSGDRVRFVALGRRRYRVSFHKAT